MRIYFVEIRYNEKPILWEHNSETNTARCLYKLVGEKDEIDPKSINEVLIEIPGVVIEKHSAIIRELALFNRTNVYNIVITTSEKPNPLLRTNSSLFSSIQEKISPRKQSPRDSERTTAIMPSGSTGAINPRTLPPKGSTWSRSATTLVTVKPLSLELLLKECRGSTLVYESDMRANNLSCLGRISLLQVHSATSVDTMVQVIKNIDLDCLRQSQMMLVRQLYVKFAEAMTSFNSQEAIPHSVLGYFRDAIIAIMRNETYNKINTGYEHAEEIDKIPVPVQDNYNLRRTYAEIMVRYFAYFVKDIPIPVKTTDVELMEWLKQFKAHLGLQPEIVSNLTELQKLIVCTGLMDHIHYSQVKKECIVQFGVLDPTLLASRIKALQMEPANTLSFALKQLRPDHQIPPDLMHNLPDKLFSLRYLVNDWCKQLTTGKIELDPGAERQMVNEIIAKVIHVFRDCTKCDKNTPAAKWISHNIGEEDKDLYITIEWKTVLSGQFNLLSQSKKEGKYVEHIQTEMVRLISNLLTEQLTKLEAENEESPRSGTSSLST